MKIQEIIEKLELKILTQTIETNNIETSNGYTSDLLSCVMAGAKPNCVWVTLQAHMNIIAVAALLEMSAIIITEDAQPEPATIAKADQQSILLLSTPRSTFEIVGNLWAMGLPAS